MTCNTRTSCSCHAFPGRGGTGHAIRHAWGRVMMHQEWGGSVGRCPHEACTVGGCGREVLLRCPCWWCMHTCIARRARGWSAGREPRSPLVPLAPQCLHLWPSSCKRGRPARRQGAEHCSQSFSDGCACACQPGEHNGRPCTPCPHAMNVCHALTTCALHPVRWRQSCPARARPCQSPAPPAWTCSLGLLRAAPPQPRLPSPPEPLSSWAALQCRHAIQVWLPVPLLWPVGVWMCLGQQQGPEPFRLRAAADEEAGRSAEAGAATATQGCAQQKTLAGGRARGLSRQPRGRSWECACVWHGPARLRRCLVRTAAPATSHRRTHGSKTFQKKKAWRLQGGTGAQPPTHVVQGLGVQA